MDVSVVFAESPRDSGLTIVLLQEILDFSKELDISYVATT
jgi:hypothetical protein